MANIIKKKLTKDVEDEGTTIMAGTEVDCIKIKKNDEIIGIPSHWLVGSS